MSEIILITGGARSGKSALAQQLGEARPAPRIYLATCPVLDDELRERIRRHREARGAGQWQTIEETLDVAGVIRRENTVGVILVECLTLWINNLLHQAHSEARAFIETDLDIALTRVLEEARRRVGTTILVTNEVGFGIIPENPLARRYRDLVGRCNQRVARDADQVVLMVCGLPVYLKR